MVNALQARNAVAEMRTLPDLEESVHVICRGNFPLWQLVPVCLSLAKPAKIDALHVATLSFNDQNTTELLELYDAGQIGSVTIIVSAFFERQNPKQFRLMADGLEKRGQRIAALRTHAKIIAMEMTDSRRLICESSANLRSCRNIEQFTLTDSPELYGFHRRWIEDVYAATKGTQGKDAASASAASAISKRGAGKNR